MNGTSEKQRMPVVFAGHGNPMNAIEKTSFSDQWVRLGTLLPRPKAILCISAHWEADGTAVTATDYPATIHDFGGFPRELYNMEYPAPGSPLLAGRIIELIHTVSVAKDHIRGLDHGCWSILVHTYPEPVIPVVQLSLNRQLTPHGHLALARELKPLRDEGVLILCSGNIVHNLRLVAWDRIHDENFGYGWAHEADNKIKELILEGNLMALCNYHTLSDAVNKAIPTPEHYLPVLYAMGAKDEQESVTFFNNECVMGSLSMTSFIIQ
jgi:4,5-DOPA dioxygenase extradiol